MTCFQRGLATSGVSAAISLLVFQAGCQENEVPTRKNKPKKQGAAGGEDTPGGADSNGSTSPGALNPQVNAPVVSGDVNSLAKSFCALAPGSGERAKLVAQFKAYRLGTRAFNLAAAKASPRACVDALLPSAIATSVRTGVPVGTLVGQALQETGFCKSKLAAEGLNFHGQKASIKTGFTHYTGLQVAIASSESHTGSGNVQVSQFMKFTHADFSFYTVTERFIHAQITFYRACMASRERPEEFMRCIGKKWAVHDTYASAVLKHRKDYGLASCELAKSEWKLDAKFQGL